MRQRSAQTSLQVQHSLYCREISQEHQENLPSYIDEEGYEGVLKTLEKILDFFEDELGRDDRPGRWLGGPQLSLADVTLGLWQSIFLSL